MKVSVPVHADAGMDSKVYGHFGSAPGFICVDTKTKEVTFIDNRDIEHTHGACSPIKALAGAKPDAAIVIGLGGGALRGLRAWGIQVFKVSGGTVREAVEQLKAGTLEEMDAAMVCGGHGNGHGCHG